MAWRKTHLSMHPATFGRTCGAKQASQVPLRAWLKVLLSPPKNYSTSSQDVSTNATSCPLLKAHTTACLSRQADDTTQSTTATRLAQTLASLERAFRNWLAQAYTLLWKPSVHVDLPRGALCGCLTHVSIGELRRSARCLRRNSGEVLIISKN